MKIQCDVCNKEEASVYCTADEAALCDGCDRRVHHANKLASKHPRFSLLHSSPSPPLCDICQEKRAFLFCQQDRAILCRDCDVSIHTANELTRNHHRFLLTGVKLSSTASLYSEDVVPDYSAANNNIKSHQPLPPPQPAVTANKNTTSSGDHQTIVPDSNNCSTISEYLMEMLPGWHVEDLLEPTTPSSTPFGFSKVDGGLLSFGETDGEADSSISYSSESERLGIWVPQAPPPPVGSFMYNKQTTGNYNVGANKRWTIDDLFTVPQISPPPSKRSRPF